MSSVGGPTPNISGAAASRSEQADTVAENKINKAAQKADRQIDSITSLTQAATTSTAARLTKGKQKLSDRADKAKNTQKAKKAKKSEKAKSKAEAETKKADSYDDNWELSDDENLEEFKKSLKDNMSHEEILNKAKTTFNDISLVDEALDYLIESVGDNPEFKTKLENAKDLLNVDEEDHRNILAGKNMGSIARDFARSGDGSKTPTELRKIYRTVTRSPQTAHQLFDFLSKDMSYKELSTTIKFLQSSLGADLKADANSKEPAKLADTLKELKKFQFIKGVFVTFEKSTATAKSMFKVMTTQFNKLKDKISNK